MLVKSCDLRAVLCKCRCICVPPDLLLRLQSLYRYDFISVFVPPPCQTGRQTQSVIDLSVLLCVIKLVAVIFLNPGAKVEIKRRWNCKIPWPLTRFSGPATFLAGPSKSQSPCFQRVI